MYVPDKDALFLISLVEFKELHSIHWEIECYHRAIKQVCGIELFMVSQCVGRVPRLVRAASPLGRSNWRTRKGADFSRDVERGIWFANVIREPNSPKNDQKICWYCRYRCE